MSLRTPGTKAVHRVYTYRVKISFHQREAADISTFYNLGSPALWTSVQCPSERMDKRPVLFLLRNVVLPLWRSTHTQWLTSHIQNPHYTTFNNTVLRTKPTHSGQPFSKSGPIPCCNTFCYWVEKISVVHLIYYRFIPIYLLRKLLGKNTKMS